MVRAGFVVAIGLSLLVHASLVGVVAALVRPPASRKIVQPFEILPAPEPPPPPELPPPAPPEPPPPPPPPRPKVVKPRIKKPVPRPIDAGVIADAAPDAPPADDAGPLEDAGPIEDAGPEDGGGESAADGGPDAIAADAGLDGGAAGPDAGAPAPPVDPGVVDLRPFLPGGERIMVVLRTQRLRGTPWGERLAALVAPMPDYRLVVAGTGLDLATSFDTVVISSAEPRVITRTFLAAHSSIDDDTLRRALARPPDGATEPRLRWNGDHAERRDPRVVAMGDPRRLFMPAPGWFVLVRPEHLEEGKRGWLDVLAKIEAQTGEGPTIAVLMVADLGTPTLTVPLPGVPSLPAPERLTVAVTALEAGLVVTGAAHFPDETTAETFVTALVGARDQALGSLGGRILLKSFHADGAARRLEVARHGASITFSTSLSNPEADALLTQAAEMAEQFFLHRGR